MAALSRVWNTIFTRFPFFFSGLFWFLWYLLHIETYLLYFVFQILLTLGVFPLRFHSTLLSKKIEIKNKIKKCFFVCSSLLLTRKCDAVSTKPDNEILQYAKVRNSYTSLSQIHSTVSKFYSLKDFQRCLKTHARKTTKTTSPLGDCSYVVINCDNGTTVSIVCSAILIRTL